MANRDTDTISRQDTIEHLKKRLYESALNNDGIASKIFEEIADNRVQIWVDELPPSPTVTADTDTISRQQGRWEMLQIPINPPVYKCAVCGGHTQDLTNFCPNCGADMRS